MIEYSNAGVRRSRRQLRLFRSLATCLFLVGLSWANDSTTENRQVFQFAASGVTFDADFEGARLNEVVQQEGDGEYRVMIRPENRPVNDSAWYAFRISSKTAQTVTIHLSYEGGKHRYHPKVSPDGTNWRRLSPDRCKRDQDSVTLRVDVGHEPIWLSAQEMLGGPELDAWMDKIAHLPFVEEAVIGRSVGGQPIRWFTFGTGEPEHAVVIIGR